MADLPDYRDKDVRPQPAALDSGLAALQRRVANLPGSESWRIVVGPEVKLGHKTLWAVNAQNELAHTEPICTVHVCAPAVFTPEQIAEALNRYLAVPTCPLCHLGPDRCHCREDEQLAGELPRPWPEPQ